MFSKLERNSGKIGSLSKPAIFYNEADALLDAVVGLLLSLVEQVVFQIGKQNQSLVLRRSGYVRYRN